MKKIVFLANCNSPHLDRWLDLLGMLGFEVEVWSIHNCEGKGHARQILPAFARKLPTILKYILAGLFLRFQKNVDFFHAHNTSGYGLTALLAGKKYIITTYGSEIFSTNKKNGIYKRLIQAVLDRSFIITSTSQEMKAVLENVYGIEPTKIQNFSLGVDTDTFFPIRKKVESAKVWIINRRMHPHYNSLETILGFIAYLELGYTGKLIVLMGDYDRDYAKMIKERVDFDRYEGSIELVEDFLNREELAQYLQQSTFSVSTPISDQLSSSILESMACGVVPLLSDLAGYIQIIESRACLVLENYGASNFQEQFVKMNEMSSQEIAALASNGLAYIQEKESSEIVKRSLTQLYNQLGRQMEPSS